MRLNAYRGLTKTMQSGIPGPEGSLGKWQWADINQGIAELALDIEGAYAPLGARRRARGRQRRLAVQLPPLARQLDRGRHDRHPQEHHRRAGARPAEAALIRRAMYFDLTDEQQAIKSTARDFLAARYQIGADPRAGRERARLRARRLGGDGGAGLAGPGAARGVGRAGAWASSSSRSSSRRWAMRSPPRRSSPTRSPGSRSPSVAPIEQRERWLRPLAAGERRGTPALWDAGSPGRRPGGFTMEAEAGRRRRRPRRREGAGDGRGGRRLLPRRHRRRQAPPGRARRRRGDGDRRSPRSTSPAGSTRSASTASGSPPPRRCPPQGADYYPVFLRLCVALAAESTGIAQRTMEMAVAYAKDRQQFGRPIGSYQAVSHRCAQMLLETENSRSAVYGAAWAADAEPESLARSPPRRRRPMPQTPAGGSPMPRSRFTAGSASPGSTTSISSSSAAAPTRRCSATPGGTASGSPTRSSPAPPEPAPGLRARAWAHWIASPLPRSATRSPTSRRRRCAPRRPGSSACGRRSCSAAQRRRRPTWRRRPSGSTSPPGSLGPSPAAPSSSRVSALDIDEMSGGRFRLGLGAGVKRLNETWHNAEYGKPAPHLREAIEATRLIMQPGR